MAPALFTLFETCRFCGGMQARGIETTTQRYNTISNSFIWENFVQSQDIGPIDSNLVKITAETRIRLACNKESFKDDKSQCRKSEDDVYKIWMACVNGDMLKVIACSKIDEERYAVARVA